ncbi:glycosyltransferase [Konateibacter massiliensis]|uniref:glycosyltransferase n=1 Tax=Konateibacter massiliensis TaxID=2002841 RepID=UPI000C158372|nr:glycosyltransferase family 2 protein [Konateibacter massiliensis]
MKTMISVCCITYNHEEYIKDTLEGILCQKFDKTYEIIIHDDASNDGTVEILKKYQRKYPDKIKLLLEEENQYQYGKKMFYEDIKIAEGKYIALCEGDDYWCDENKLQKQYDFMEKNTEISYLCHGAYMEVYGNKKQEELRAFDCERMIELEAVLEKGWIFPTASLFLRRSCFSTVSKFYLGAPIEDEPIKLLCLSRGKGFYMNSLMCVYRKNHPGSWNKVVKHDKEKRLEHHRAKVKMYQEFNDDTNGKYYKSIEDAIILEEFNIIMTNQTYGELRSDKYKNIVNALNTKARIRLSIAARIPKVYKTILKIYKVCMSKGN